MRAVTTLALLLVTGGAISFPVNGSMQADRG